MKITRSVAAMQQLAIQWKSKGHSTALVPTMGFLHEGHLSLVARARQLVGTKGIVTLSIYVNPTQFAANEDLSKYPQDFAADRAKCGEAGVDVLFAPTNEQIYGRHNGLPFATFITEECLTQTMEGASRPTHFRGVATIVAKLFNIVLPEFAVFGAKDFQQAAMIKKMSRDLNFPVKIVTSGTCREPDGLAMSSRNKYLSPEERAQATILFRSIREARKLTNRGEVPAVLLKAKIASIISSAPDARLDYVEIFEPTSLEAMPMAKRGTQLALAVFVGKTRLIDNALL